MTRKTALVALCFTMIGVGFGWGSTQLESQASLTTQDYIDIQNLYHTYTRFTDMGGAGDGSDYASLFTEDGTFNQAEGTEALKGMITGFHERLRRDGWSSRHTYTGLVITPTPEGAKGSVYLLTFNVTAEPPFVDHSGVYEDWLVKTADGWKYKKRIYRDSRSFEPSMRQGMDEIFVSQ